MPETPVLAVFTADWHTNSIVGLNPPQYQREHGSAWTPGKVGRAKWRAWLEFWEMMAEKKAKHGATCCAFVAGDVGDKNLKTAVELISTYDPDIIRAMQDVGEPMIAVADKVFVYRGTATHSGGNGELEELYARSIGAEPDERRGYVSWFAGRHELGGVVFEVTHRPPTRGTLPYTEDPAVARAALIVATRYMKQRQARCVPDVCVWAHVHYKGEGHGLGVHGFFLPPWQTTTAYGYGLGVGDLPVEIGGLWFLCQDGRYGWDWETWTPEKLETWRPTT